MMKRLREEFRSTNCRLEIPTAVTIPVKHSDNSWTYFWRCFDKTNGKWYGVGWRKDKWILTKHDNEDATDDGVRNRYEDRSKFAEHPKDDHNHRTNLDHTPASNLHV